MGRLIAAADVGSNTAHLLIAHLTDTGFKRLVNESEWLSLGEVVGREGRIPPAKVKELIATLARFRSLMDQYRVDEAAFFATEAMRRAENHLEVVETIEGELGLQIEIISPFREAELSYLSSQIDTPGPEPFVMIEAGGGSVQVAYCVGGKIDKLTSLPIGSGALRAVSGLDQPPTEYSLTRATEVINSACEAVSGYPKPERIVACGGVARGLWRALHPDGDRRLHAKALEFLIWDCSRLTTDVIVDRYNVKVNRAKTLLAGAMAVRHLMDVFGIEEIEVSRYGLREGAVLELAGKEEISWLST